MSPPQLKGFLKNILHLFQEQRESRECFPNFYSICMKFISYPIIDKFALVHMNNVCANSIQEILRMGYDYQGSLVTARKSNFAKIVIYKLMSVKNEKKNRRSEISPLANLSKSQSLKSINSLKGMTVKSITFPKAHVS